MTGECLLSILESRLDNVIFRMCLANTRREARQIVHHNHVLVNGKRVNIPSYLVKPGDVITLKESSKNADRMKEIVERNSNRLIPKWIDMNRETLEGKITAPASRDDIDFPVEEHLIVEFYSR